MKIRALFVVIIYMLLTISVSGQESKRAKISGHVRDAEGYPIELVNVSVKGTVIGTATNEKGYYSLSVNKGDSVTLVFSCLGYNKAERIIPELSQDMSLHVKMSYMSFGLEEVTVTSHRIRTDMMESLDASKIRRLPDPSGGSIESLVVTYAGVSQSNELSSQYSVRGGSYDENIVYVNGLEVFRPFLIRSGQQEGLSFINPEMTENVQFSAGGFEARYGDKMSSVLDITYKKPEGFEGSVSASMLGASAYVGSSSGKFTQITGLRYKTNRSLLGTMDTDAEYNPNYTDLQTYITYRLTPKLEADFLGNLSVNNYNFTPHTRETLYGTVQNPRLFRVHFEGKERDRFQTLFGALTLKYTQSENIQYGVQTSAFNSREEESYDITGSYSQNSAEAGASTEEIASPLDVASYHEHARNKLHSNVANIGFFGNARINASNTLKFGVNAQYEHIMDRISEWESRDSSGYSLPQNGSTVNVISNLFSDNELESWRYSGYVQDVFKFRTEKGIFTVIGGLRGSYWDYNKEFIISPRLSVAFIPVANQHLILRFATGFYYQPPFYKELRITEQDEYGNNIIALNNKLKSQRSTHFILGGDYTFRAAGRNFKFTSELYYKKLDHVNPYTVDNVKIRYYGENCAKGYAMGVDMKLFGEFVPGADSWLSVSLMRSKQTINETLKVPMPNDQQYNISLYFQDYFPGNKRAMVNLKGILSGGLPVTIPNKGWESYKRRTPPYRRVDIGFSYQIAGGKDAIMDRPFFRNFKNIWLGFDVFNLFDIGNTNSYYWITDVYNEQYAVPNYLTGRQLNFRLSVDF
ncbi:MAG TPA: TonB-dependent receptor [Porphyromonadaceae bacterium]|nr:TonB-dependent receptor [Porphyromonadaceae bacterium]